MQEVGSLVCTPAERGNVYGDELNVCKPVSAHEQFVREPEVLIRFGVRHQDLCFLSFQPTEQVFVTSRILQAERKKSIQAMVTV